MVMVKKSNESGGAPSLDILAAKLRVVETEFFAEPYEVNLDNGRSFEADPNVNVRVEVLKNLVEPGKDEGERFFDRFKLKQDKNGDWVFAKYSKLGNLMMVLYGQDWFEDKTAGFDENDLLDFEFIAQVEKFFVRRIMRHADGVHVRILHRFNVETMHRLTQTTPRIRPERVAIRSFQNDALAI